jgi:predicted secreted hydrolase
VNVSWLSSMALAILAAFAPSAAAAQSFAGLGAKAQGFAEVTPGKPVAFPQDFGAHPGFRTEWWYLTANLKDASGASYGAQWTLFRQGMAPGPEREGWGNLSVWMGHAAVTSASEHLFAETLARGGVGQAGVSADPFRAWIDDWSLATPAGSPSRGLSRLRAVAGGSDFRYALNLSAEKPIVLHGEDGFSRKSERGQASYYFSQPFFTVEGALVLHGQEVKVSGHAWMDREWSSQPLAPGQKGWDWFSLHLSGGEKVMLFRLRSDREPDFLAGTWIGADGEAQALGAGDITLTPLSEARLADRTLPARWKVEVKSRGVAIDVRPLQLKSWMATQIPYWEGPISFQGSHQGEGYLEMTGY